MKKAYLLLLFPSVLLAGVELQNTIPDVYHRGDHERVGTLTMTVRGNDFSAASPDEAIFIRIIYGQGAVNGDTLVDLSSNDANLSQPVFLAMRICCQPEEIRMVAPPETISIVRWVQGEDAVWLRVQYSSDTWLMDAEGNPVPPGKDRPVSWSIGTYARSSDDQHGAGSNLPFNTRNPTPQGVADAVSILRCLDLRHSSLGTEGQASLLRHDIQAFGADADKGDGTFGEGSATGIDITGSLIIARGKMRRIMATPDTSNFRGSVDEEDGYPVVRRILSLNLSEDVGDRYVSSSLVDGATVTLSTMGNSGFTENGAVFFDGCDSFGMATVNPETAFELDGRPVYREITLTWNGGIRRINQLTLLVQASLCVPMGNLDDALPELTWELEQSSQGIADTAPYDGPNQLFHCRLSNWKMGGTWQPLTPIDNKDSFLPHITRHGGSFTTLVDLANPYDSGKGYLIYGFDADGRWLGTRTGLLAAGERRSLPPDALFDNPDLSHLRVSVVSSVSVGLTYQAIGVGKAPASVPEVQGVAPSWLIRPGNPAITFDGLALVNLGNDYTEVTLEEINAAGKVVKTTILEDALAPMGKLLHELRPSEEGTYFVVNTREKCVVTALRGNTGAGFLWVNSAQPMCP